LQFEDRIHLNGRQAAGNRARRFPFDSTELVLSAIQLDASIFLDFPFSVTVTSCSEKT